MEQSLTPSPILETTVTLKLWKEDKTNGGWDLIHEIKSLASATVPPYYSYNTELFKRQEHKFLGDKELVCSYVQIRAINLCSKCHVNFKAPISFPAKRFDHWCDRCYTETPSIQRTRKCSRGEKKKLLQAQQQATQKKEELRAAFLVEQESRRALTAKSKSTYKPQKKLKKGSDAPFSLDLDFTDTPNTQCELRTENIDCDTRRQAIAETQDPSIFDEESLDD